MVKLNINFLIPIREVISQDKPSPQNLEKELHPERYNNQV